MNETQLRELILKAISEAVGDTAGAQSAAPVPPASGSVESGEVRDLSAVDFRQIIDVPTPANPEEFRRMRSKTVARIGVWRAGPRCRTNTYLRFRADHAAAMDAVFTDVPERLLEEMGLFTVQTLCETKDMYLTRPIWAAASLRRLWPSSSSAASAIPTCSSWCPTACPAPQCPPTSETSCPPSFKG